jgi:hypothetical protein
MKELQKTVFFAAYDSVVFSSGRSMTEKEQKQLLQKSIIHLKNKFCITIIYLLLFFSFY